MRKAQICATQMGGNDVIATFYVSSVKQRYSPQYSIDCLLTQPVYFCDAR